MYINHRQGNWLEWLATIEFVFNNKVHTSTKSLLFKFNYRREQKKGFKIIKKRKYVKTEEFVKEMKEMHKKAKVALKKSQKEMKIYVDRNRKKVVDMGDKK